MKKGRIYLAASNDLVIDQRLHRTATTLMESGLQPVLLGRKSLRREPVPERPYPLRRLGMLFRKGFFMYACLNARLFIFLLFRRMGLLVSVDLDTLPACYLVSRLRGITLVYDSHEFFTELPELQGRSFVRAVWRGIEKNLLPRLAHVYTVSGSIAKAYHDRYGMHMSVVRNLPFGDRQEMRRPDLLDCNPRRIIIYQGALNAGRGLESMIAAMKYLDHFHLQIFGTGPLEKELRSLATRLEPDDRITFMGRVPFDELRQHTRQASLGISIEEQLGLNYYYALPNKLFDYIQAGVPVLVSPFPEMKFIIDHYGVGEVLESHDPAILARQVKSMMEDDLKRMEWKKNLSSAADELCWEKEAGKLRDVYRSAGLTFP
jgi:glycosyltransferase involved in cell wall biosynthesis